MANGYGNRQGVGDAIKDCWLGQGKARKDLFVMTKTPGGLNSSEVAAAHAENMELLQPGPARNPHTRGLVGQGYHCSSAARRPRRHRLHRGTFARRPLPFLLPAGPYGMPGAGRGEMPALSNPAMRQEEWLALEAAYYSGGARSIGVSHCCTAHLGVIAMVTVTPSVNQAEYHVRAEIGTYFMSCSPLCGPCIYTPSNSLIDGDLVSVIASHYPGVKGR